MSGRFPPDFLWGTATAAHQIEGNNTNSDWWAFEHTSHPRIKEPSGDAADSYHRWGEDMDLLAGAGFTDYRFSIEWARVEPAPDEFSAAQLAHYRRMIDGARDRGLRPLVTLHHFTGPRWFAERGGWMSADAVDRFMRYVEAVAPILGDVDHVCTINEPHVVALIARLIAGTADRDMAGLEPDPRASAALIEAHHQAAPILRAHWPRQQVGWSLAWVNAYADPGAEDAAERYAQPRQIVFADASRDDDWVGVQSYTRTKVGVVDGWLTELKLGPGVERTLTGWEFYPQAIGDAVRTVASLVGDIPIIVTENGVATDGDERRIAYTDAALTSVQQAMADGVDVRGYFHWSLLDNYEWGSYRPTFGLVAVDKTTFARYPKPSLAWLGSHK